MSTTNETDIEIDIEESTGAAEAAVESGIDALGGALDDVLYHAMTLIGDLTAVFGLVG